MTGDRSRSEVDANGEFGSKMGDDCSFMDSRKRDKLDFEHMLSSHWLMDGLRHTIIR